MSIRGVAFDYGKVICYPPDGIELKVLAEKVGMTRKAFESLMWSYRGDYDRGKLSGVEYYRNFLAAAGVFPDKWTLIKMVAVDLSSWTRINKGTEQLMKDVKRAGFKLGILSNMPRDFLVMARMRFPVFKLPHAGIFSCEAASVKPEEKIYRDCCAALGLEPEELVFFDDMPVNIEAACSLGIRGFVWKDPETARETLRRLSVPV
jgi:putative hydrolase of the HAD superfamily